MTGTTVSHYRVLEKIGGGMGVVYKADDSRLGRAPFRGDSAQASMCAILNAAPAPIQRTQRTVPADLERVVSRALAKSADERYQSAREFAADLRACRRKLDSGATPAACQNGSTAIAGTRGAALVGRGRRPMNSMSRDLQARTIADFGEQWTAFPDSEGFFGSAALLNDFLEPLVAVDEVSGLRVAEIGAGTGRFVSVLAAAGARHVIALEPSSAFTVLLEKTRRFADRITYLNVPGDQLPGRGDLDLVFAIGVLHHIPDPDAVVAAAFQGLRRGGRFAAWLYGREGNTLYLLLVRSLWWFTRRLPHRGLSWFVRLIYPIFWCYMRICRVLPLPLAAYIRRVMLPLAPDMRRIVIYDQLNPAYAKYYTRVEARDLFSRNGFTNIRLNHRHGISWTIVGTRP